MLFCQQKDAKRAVTIIILVAVLHFFVVWFVCLKTVVHHFKIPLSVASQSIKIKLKRAVPVTKNQVTQSVQKQHAKKPEPVTKKKSKAPTKQSVQKVPVQVPIKKSDNPQKVIEAKKTDVKEVQKIVTSKKIQETKKISDDVTANNLVQQKNAQVAKSNISDHKEGLKQGHITSKVDYYEVVYETIIEQWRPPIGIVKGTSCTVSFTIDQKGLPIDVVFEKKSGVLMFDMSIKTVLAHSAFSSLFVGNRFSIVFTV